MKLFYTKRSPYARKIRVMALEKKIPLELIEEDLTKKSSTLIKSNPLGKIPALILDNGDILLDSPVICEYIDFLSDDPKLIATELNLRFRALHLEAIADGLMDVTVGAYMEKQRHPKDFHQGFMAAQEETIARTLTFFEENIKELNSLSLVSIAVASSLGYIQFRLASLAPNATTPKLKEWFEEFSKRPSMLETRPG